jgi:hypothetical protein
VEPTGAHLTVQLSDERAAGLRDQLSRLLDETPDSAL